MDSDPNLFPDELPISTPDEQQIDITLLTAAEVAAADLPNILACLVVHDGFIISENYYGGRTAATKNHLRSITKGITSLLVGIAVDQGLLKSLDTPILEYFPEYNKSTVDKH